MLKTLNQCEHRRALAWHAGQVPAFGKRKQARLYDSKVVIVGCGRIGASVALALHACGVGHLVLIDGQNVETEQLGPFVWAHPADLGRAKVTVLERVLSSRQFGVIEAIPKPVEAAGFEEHLDDADLVICCANDPRARLFVEYTAITRIAPVMQVAVDDAREHLGGTITIRTAEDTELACYGCLRPSEMKPRRPSVLATNATAVLAHIGAHMAVTLLTDFRADALLHHNLFVVNLEQFTVEALAVQRRPGCEVCG